MCNYLTLYVPQGPRTPHPRKVLTSTYDRYLPDYTRPTINLQLDPSRPRSTRAIRSTHQTRAPVLSHPRDNLKFPTFKTPNSIIF